MYLGAIAFMVYQMVLAEAVAATEASRVLMPRISGRR